MGLRGVIVEEFLKADWKTYAFVELKEDDDEGSAEEHEARLDTLTRILYAGRHEDKELAVSLLGRWLRKPANTHRPSWLSFKLRRILYLQNLRHCKAAIDELAELLAQPPYQQFASLHCLLGNLLGYVDRYEQAINSFDQAIAIAPEWPEPQLEEVEKLILLGPAGHARAADNASKYLERRGNSERTRLILLTNLIVARSLTEEGFVQSKEYAGLRETADKITVPNSERETWNFRDVIKQLLTSSRLTKDESNALSDWLLVLETRIGPEK